MKKIYALFAGLFFVIWMNYSHAATLNLTFYIEGYYVGARQMQPVLFNEGVCTGPVCLTRTDTVVIELHAATSPYAMVQFYKGIVLTNGTISCTYTNAIISNSYYIAIRHRNALET